MGVTTTAEKMAQMEQLFPSSEVSVRARHVLAREGVLSVERLAAISDEELLSFRNFSKGSLAEVAPARARARAAVAARQEAERRRELVDRIREAIRAELVEQFDGGGWLKPDPFNDSWLEVDGTIDIEELAKTIVGLVGGSGEDGQHG